MQLPHDIFIIKKAYSLKDKEETAKAHVKVLDDLRNVGEVREAKLEEKLWASKNAIRELGAQIVEKDEEITKGSNYTIDLETRLADTVSKKMVLESRVDIVGFKLEKAKVMAQKVEERA